MHPIELVGARTHNLASVSLTLRAGEVLCLTGPSGSGKSSLALDTLHAEGQRRFVESFSPYARQFLERLERPPVTSLEPVAASVAIDRRAPFKSSRSTLSTLADLAPYFSALFGADARPLCPACGCEGVETQTADAAARAIEELKGRRGLVTYAVRAATQDAYLELRDDLAKHGFRRLWRGDALTTIDELKPSEALESPLSVVVDRITLDARSKRRVGEAIEQAWQRGHGLAQVIDLDGADGSRAITLQKGLACASCGTELSPPRPGYFSASSPLGACATCKGFGRSIAVDLRKVIPDGRLSLAKGAIRAWSGSSAATERKLLARFAKKHSIPFDAPWDALSVAQRELVLEGEGSWEGGRYPGVRAWFSWLETKTYKMHVRVFLARYREYVSCASCGGSRLNERARSYRVAQRTFGEWHALTVAEARAALASYAPRSPHGADAQSALGARLSFLETVGLSYLTLDRQARTLSGGETQRASLTTALGAGLTGTLFVLDEPTLGLHASDVTPLCAAIGDLAAHGNAVVVVEHDRAVIESADRVVELGPGAGAAGGRICFDGPPGALAESDTATGRAWRTSAAGPRATRPGRGRLVLRGAREHNLSIDEVAIPLGTLTAVTGPSGSGKSTLVEDVLYRSLARRLGIVGTPPEGLVDHVEGGEAVRRAVLVDQAPLGRTARGNPGTYTKAWDRIRARFAKEPEAVARGYGPSHFSFNVAGKGRCDACSGEGFETVEMQFLADVQLLCPVCRGARFKRDILDIRCEGRSVADVLAMTVSEALATFDRTDDRDWVLSRALEPLVAVGLAYLPLGQPLSTLSGGEAQRLKLARALAEPATDALFVVDEPSAGLHASDVLRVVDTLHHLVDQGATVVVVDHDLDVVRAADHVIDLGPGGGPSGGRLVAVGTPSDLARAPTKTGDALRRPAAPRPRSRAVAAERREGIVIVGAREHNLRDVSCTIARGALTVVTGPSGSGKSSLAFDVLFAEGQRRFIETLTPYARQFLPTLPKPAVTEVRGVPPSIALEQRTTRGGASSTVATVTEIAHYLRLLYAKVGTVHCPDCGAALGESDVDALLAAARRGRAKDPVLVLAPAVRARKGTHLDVFTRATRAGIARARVDGALVSCDPPPALARAREHTVELVLFDGPRGDVDHDVLARALDAGSGTAILAPRRAAADGEELLLSTRRACARCGVGIPELDPRWFSFNTVQGQCPRCEGAGEVPRGSSGATKTCPECDGTRLAPLPRGVTLAGRGYGDVMAMSVGEALAHVRALEVSGRAALVADAPRSELERRLRFIDEVGLSYLSLGRHAATLSGGELQRLRLAAQIGSGLTGALYVLDEPTIGLHPSDTGRLLENLRALVDTGSTVVVVEHDVDVIGAADALLDLGPGGGRHGGHIVAQGTVAEVLANAASPTGRALAEERRPLRTPRGPSDARLVLRGARAHNLAGVDVAIPMGRMTTVCGVSGSGKSTLVSKVLFPAVRARLGLVTEPALGHDRLELPRELRRALAIDQSPIGRTSRSTPATYLGIWDEIRKLYARLPDAQVRGFGAARFSFNTPSGGRCGGCEGQGVIAHAMSFLPDVVVACETCRGLRFEDATLEVRFRGASVGDVLSMTATEAIDLFATHPKIRRPLELLSALGVDYVTLGQPSSTLSGGEAQRVKLAAELGAGVKHEPTLYVLDEPTTGLHLSDARKLVTVLDQLVARGDTVVVIEHHPLVIESSDWTVELGPSGGAGGGRIVFEGTPADLARANTATGAALRPKRQAPRKRR